MKPSPLLYLDVKTNLVMEKYRRGILTEMLKDSGIKGAIIKKYIPMFNKQINSYLKIMEADYSFTLNEEFSETIKSRGREEFSYGNEYNRVMSNRNPGWMVEDYYD